MPFDPSAPAANADDETRPVSQAPRVFFVLAAVALIAVLFSLLARGRSDSVSVAPGRDAPPIEAAGWLNGPPPTADTFRNKVVLLNIWASWCHGCRLEAPHLAQIHQHYADRGVVFVSLTNEGERNLTRVRDILQTNQIKWLNGWGAVDTLVELNTQFLPTSYVIGADGKLLWESHQGGTVEEALDRALALADSKL